jgi:hypothetical protein
MNPHRHHRSADFRGGPIAPQFPGRERLGESPKPDHHTAALCKQVRRIVSTVLSGECGDPVLQDLLVEQVAPAPNASRLLITLFVRRPYATLVELLVRLDAVKGLLRARIAEGTVRKRVPELAFLVLPIGALPEPEGEQP